MDDKSFRLDQDQNYAVVVVHYENPKVYELLNDLQSLNYAPRRIVIADNSNSIDPARIDNKGNPITVLALDNPGYGAGVNEAAKALGDTSDYILVLTHEVRITDEAAIGLLDEMKANPSAAVVAPTLVSSVDVNEVYSAGGRYGIGGRPIHILHDRHPFLVEYVDGAVLMIRRTAFDAIKGFDEKYFLYYEDNDICWRFRKSGYQIRVSADVKVPQETGNFTSYYQLRNQILFSINRYRTWEVGICILYKLLGAIRRSARERSSRHFKDAVRGIRDGVRGISGPDRRHKTCERAWMVA